MMISKWIGPSALVLMTCLCFTVQCFEFMSTASNYRKTIVFLSTVLKQESLWKHVFNQSVYYEFDRHYYKKIIDVHLLKGARENAVGVRKCTEVENDKCESTKPVGEPIKTRVIIRNLFLKWYRVGTLLHSSFQILQIAFRCLTYKHFSILITLIRVEISRRKDQKRAINWSIKAKMIVKDILMKMASLQFIDGAIIRLAKFLNIYERGLSDDTNQKFNYVPTLDDLIVAMMKFVCQNCYKFEPTDSDARVSGIWEIAVELNVRISKSLFNPSESKQIDDKTFKKMFVSSMDRITEHFSGLPAALGLSIYQWNSILHFDLEKDKVGDDDIYYLSIK